MGSSAPYVLSGIQAVGRAQPSSIHASTCVSKCLSQPPPFPKRQEKERKQITFKNMSQKLYTSFPLNYIVSTGAPMSTAKPEWGGVVIPKDGRGYFSSIKDLLILGDSNSFCHARFSGKTQVSFRKPKSSSAL